MTNEEPSLGADHDKRFNTLQKRYTKLRDRKISVETQKTSIGEQLSALQAAAVEHFETHDIGELKIQLQEMETANEQKLSDYQKKLNEIDQKLAEIDNTLNQEDAPAE